MTPIAPDLSWLWGFGLQAATVGVVLCFVSYLYGLMVGIPLRWSERALGG